MGHPGIDGGPVTAVARLDREHGIALLDRAAETGLLTSYGDGYYAVHPAIPWHLRRLFEHHYGPPASPAAQHAIRAWTEAISDIGNYWISRYREVALDAIEVLGAEEDNLLRARQLARQNGWWDLAIGPMQGLSVLYLHTGRREWRRLVAELTPDLADPETDGPLPAAKTNGPCTPITASALLWRPGTGPAPRNSRKRSSAGNGIILRVLSPLTPNAQRQPAGGTILQLGGSPRGTRSYSDRTGQSRTAWIPSSKR